MSELYHVLNRGVDKRDIFLDDRDRARFVHDLWEFNDTEDVDNTRHRVPDITGLRDPYIPKERIVDLHGWCIMNNHYHLLISELAEGGLTKFIRRLNVGYANYFNERYKRAGTLFQGRTKKIPIEHDAHFLYILHYIHLNPLDYLKGARSWRLGHIGSADKALKHLDNYRWSSYLDYSGEPNFPSILSPELFADVFKNYKKSITGWLKDIEQLRIYNLE
jgi:putative transposase